MFICAMASARFMASQCPGETAYVLGENGLAKPLHINGFTVSDDNVDFVVVGVGRVINYEVLERATRLVERWARLIATNMDTRRPTEDGVRPGCGALVAMIEKAIGNEAFSVGRPSPVMMRIARHELGLRTGEVVMVGDTMYTDILGGVQMEYTTVWGLSGHTSVEGADEYSYRPDHILESVADIPPKLLSMRRQEVGFR